MMSDFAFKVLPSFCLRSSSKRGLSLVVAGALAFGAMVASVQAQGPNAQGTKIGFVNTERILRESAPAKAAQSMIEAEFKKRDDELQRMATNLQTQAEKFAKDAPVLSESDRVKRQRDLTNLETELQRKRREFQEDINRRRNDEFSSIVSKANEAIKRIAEQENYDLIVQDAVTVSPRVDITERVLQSLGK